MPDLRRPVSALLTGVLVAGLLTGFAPAVPAPGPTNRSAGSDELSVVELDLTGVSTAAAADLPVPESVPTSEGAATDEGAATELQAAEPPSAAPDPVSPQPTATPSPEATAEPTPAPTDEPAPESPPAARTAPEPGTGADADPDVLTVEMETAPFSVLGVTWDRTPGLDGVQIRYRVRLDGEWTQWAGVESSDVASDVDTDDGGSDARDGTDPIVAVGADGVQIWAQASSGTVTGLTAVLVDPGADPATTGQLATPGGSSDTAARGAVSDGSAVVRTLGTSGEATVRAAAVAQPGIISRAGWGADESLRTCDADLSTQVVSAAVHHTASANGYSAAAIPGIIRGFYAFHTRPEAAAGATSATTSWSTSSVECSRDGRAASTPPSSACTQAGSTAAPSGSRRSGTSRPRPRPVPCWRV